MRKEVFVLIVLVLFISGCGKNTNITNSDIEKLKSEIASLKQSGNNYEVGKKIFELNLAIAKANKVRPGNEPFLLEKKDNTNCVVLAHGFTASPWEIKELGEYLAKRNITVYGVLIAGHGTTREDLAKTSWEDWENSFQDAYSALNYMCDNIFVGGVSTGGSLALYIAEQNKTKGVISLASIIYPNNENAKYAFIAKYFKHYFENSLKDDEKPYYYSYRPTAGIAELIEFVDVYKKNLNKVKAPVLIMQYNNDSTINPESAKFIYNHVGSEKKELIWLNGSDHVLTHGNDREQVFEVVYNFIIKNS